MGRMLECYVALAGRFKEDNILVFHPSLRIYVWSSSYTNNK